MVSKMQTYVYVFDIATFWMYHLKCQIYMTYLKIVPYLKASIKKVCCQTHPHNGTHAGAYLKQRLYNKVLFDYVCLYV